MESIGKRILMIRSAAHLNQRDFAASIGISGGSVSMLETGTNNPSEQTIKLICREFGVSYDWLTEGIGPMYVPQSDSDIELITRAMEGKNENKKQLIRIMAEMPDELLDKMMEYLESRLK